MNPNPINPELDRILREQAEAFGATGDTRFLGSFTPLDRSQDPPTNYMGDRGRTSGWTDPAGAARALNEPGALDSLPDYIASWAAPLDGVSRALGGAISGRNPMDTANNPPLSDALIEKGVPKWLAYGAEFFVPDPTGAKTVGDLIPFLGMLASPRGIAAMREFIERAFHMSNALPTGTARRAFVAGGILREVDNALEAATKEGLSSYELVDLMHLREQVYDLVDWDSPVIPISPRSSNVNPVDAAAMAYGLETIGNAELSDVDANQLSRLLHRWNQTDLDIEDMFKDQGLLEIYRNAGDPGSLRHNDANVILEQIVDANRALGNDLDVMTAYGRTQEVVEQFGAGADPLLRSADVKPPPRGTLTNAGSDVASDALAARGQTRLPPGAADLFVDPTVADTMDELLETMGIDVEELAGIVKEIGLDTAMTRITRMMHARNPMWDAETARMAIRAVVNEIYGR